MRTGHNGDRGDWSRWPSPASIPITSLTPPSLPPFFPPLMRGAVVANTEKDKSLDVQLCMPGEATCWCLGSGHGPVESGSWLFVARQHEWQRGGPRPPRELSGKIVTTCDKILENQVMCRVLKSCRPHCLGLTHRTW